MRVLKRVLACALAVLLILPSASTKAAELPANEGRENIVYVDQTRRTGCQTGCSYSLVCIHIKPHKTLFPKVWMKTSLPLSSHEGLKSV